MRELSLNILDIATNSIEAHATRLIIFIEESKARNLLRIRIKDNGVGMEKELVKTVLDPFVTTRTTRSIGMGLSLFWQLAKQCGGDMSIASTPGVGTLVTAEFQLNNLNRPPLGDMADSVVNLAIGSIDTHICYIHKTDLGCMRFDSYWLLARMAESGQPFHAMATPAKDRIRSKLATLQ